MCLCLKRSLPHHIVLYIGGIKLSVCLSVYNASSHADHEDKASSFSDHKYNQEQLDASKGSRGDETFIQAYKRAASQTNESAMQ